jgi:hypothetical protein
MLKAARFRRIIDLMERRFEEWDKDLTLVRAAARDVSVAELSLRHRVAVARRSGHSWAAIGVVLGISEQAAQERFGRYGEETA